MNTVTFKQTGYGQWTVSTEYYGKTIKMHFTDAPTFDLITSKDRGYKSAIRRLRASIINHNNN